MAYVTDNELGSGGDYDVGPKWRRELVRFLKGVDVLIHDAMYTPDDLDQHRGWGHSSYAEAVALAAEAGELGSSCCSTTAPSTTTRRWTSWSRRHRPRRRKRGMPSR